MSGLPDAVDQPPACGACGGDTTYDDGHVCYDCGLIFDVDDLSASFLDPDTPVCGAPCDNTWHHRRGAIWPNKAFRCHPCQLPTGHDSMHWTGCQVVTITEVGTEAL